MTLPNQRHHFDIPDEIAYLNCAYMSPLMHAVREAGEIGVGRKAQPWRIQPSDFFAESEVARGLFAQLVGAQASDVAIIPSASYGIALAAHNLPIQPGQRIVLLEDQFPSNVYAWYDLAQRRAATVVTVPRPEDDDWTRALLAAIDERSAIVAVPNCHWTDGSLVRLPAVGRRVREVGAALVVDATQSLGAGPFDIAEVRPDFLVAVTYKWLLGPYSLGFVYIDPKYRDGHPIEQTWLGRPGSENFARLVDYQPSLRPDARRFDVGERSNFALMPMAIAALRQILAWGVSEIAVTVKGLTDEIERRAHAIGLRTTPAALRAPHMLGLRLRGDVPDDLPQHLAAAGVFVSVRGQSIRVSPHVYNTRADVERLFAVLEEVLV